MHLHIPYNSMLKHRFWEIAAATIEDLAFGISCSRESDGVGRRVCRGQALSSGLLLRQADGRYLLWVTRPDPKDAKKSEWRMALKI
jgi:hypothetical protein